MQLWKIEPSYYCRRVLTQKLPPVKFAWQSKALKNIGSGPDRLHGQILIILGDRLNILTQLFNKCYNTGQLPKN